MDGIATHTLRTGNQFQVFQHDSGFVTVDEAHALAGWDWAVVLLPEEYMNGNPIRRWVTGVCYLALQITVGSTCAPDRLPVVWLMPWFELSFFSSTVDGDTFKPRVPRFLAGFERFAKMKRTYLAAAVSQNQPE